jgi:twitching motility two-component system response regulator PilH
MNEQPKRVLVVDDDADVRELLASVLGQHSLHVDQAEGGEQAIELLRLHRYAVVLLDLIMPGVDGFAVLETMKHDPSLSSPVVLVLSGADRHVIERLDAQRIHGIVKKPFDPAEIASIVVACSEIKSRSAFETMALAATMLGGAPLLAWLQNGKI